MRHLRALLLVLLLPAAVLAIDVNDPPMGVFADDWYAVMLQGSKSGHMHATMERIKGKDGDVIKNCTKMVIVAGRGESSMTITVDQETEETLKGEPLRFTNTMKMGKIPMTTTGRIADGKVTVVNKQLGIATDKQVYDMPKGAVMSWGTYREEMSRGLKPGTSYDLSVYDPSTSPNKLITAKVEIFDKEQVDLFGRKVEAIKTRQTMKIPMMGKDMEVPTTIWLTDEGDAVKMEMKIMELAVELIACPKTAALAKDQPAELMVDTFIHVKEPVDEHAEAITYQLEWEGAKEAPEVPTSDMQKIVKQDSTSVTITNTRFSARQKAGYKGEALSAEDLKRYTAVTSVLNYKDPEVAKVAKKAAGEEKDPLKLARKLRRFVTEYVKAKNLSVGFASASEVARSKEGDCTEHGVLLAALGRAAGLPTRLAVGFVYADEFLGKENIFVGHMWTQFYIDGQWVDEDAALRQDDVDPTHIALGLSDGGDNGVADLAGGIWIGKPKLTVLSKVTKEAEKPADPEKKP